MKTNQKLMNEFSIEELETRFEMKPWIIYEISDNPEHCHGQR